LGDQRRCSKSFEDSIREKIMTTIFEKIIKGELPANIHYEDEEVICIDDKYPQAPIHLLVITKKPIPSIHEMSEADYYLLGNVFKVIKMLADQMNFEDSYRIITNHGSGAGQTVPHLHFHVLSGRQLGAKGG